MAHSRLPAVNYEGIVFNERAAGVSTAVERCVERAIFAAAGGESGGGAGALCHGCLIAFAGGDGGSWGTGCDPEPDVPGWYAGPSTGCRWRSESRAAGGSDHA